MEVRNLKIIFFFKILIKLWQKYNNDINNINYEK